MRKNSTRKRAFSLLLCLLATAGCREIRGRRMLQEGNGFYKELRYSEAVKSYEVASQFLPNFPTLWMNKGIACRQLMIPGAKTPENDQAVSCAIEAFGKLKDLRPSDPRGEQLYIQTLFDADRLDTLAGLYGERVAKNPNDVESVNGLVQVYSKWNKFDETLKWYRRKAELQPRDAETQYAVGVYLWQRLYQLGGGNDKAVFDPRPNPNKPKEVKTPPFFSVGDVMGSERIRLADEGITYLKQALTIRPKYHEAMVYVNLLYRQKSFAFFGQPDKWQECIDEATKWQKEAIAAMPAPSSSAPSAEPPQGGPRP